jgi:hypothetical protein
MRYNIFNQIHKALRALLYDTANTLQQTDFTNEQEAAEALKKVQQVIAVFDKHAHHEDNDVLPAIEKFDSGITAYFAQEHHEDIALGQKISGLMDACNQAGSSAKKMEAGLALHHAFIEFMVFNLNHMAKEERILNPILWKHYDDTQIVAINTSVVAKISQADLEFTSFWMIKSLNNQEIISWLKQVRAHDTEPAFNGLYALAGMILPAGRWQLIQQSLKEAAVVAR